MNGDIKLARQWAEAMGNLVANRPTERAAFDLWEFGYINLRAYFGNMIIPRYAVKKQLTLHADELEDMQTAYGCIGQRCNNCDDRLPLTRQYWHVDKTQKLGYKTICKKCIKGQKQL